MRSAIAIIPLFALMRLGLAEWDWNAVPGDCRSQCEPVANIFSDCGREVGEDASNDFFRDGKLDLDQDDDPVIKQKYVDCVCNKQNARTDIPNCSDCLEREGFTDKEVSDFVRTCNFAGATGGPNTTASPTSTLTTTNTAGSTILSTLAPTSANITGTGVNNNQPAQATGAASRVGAQNVLVAAALVGLPAAFL